MRKIVTAFILSTLVLVWTIPVQAQTYRHPRQPIRTYGGPRFAPPHNVAPRYVGPRYIQPRKIGRAHV